MSKKRVIRMSVAALMLSQSAAYAQTDRTQGVANQAISQAKQNISVLQVQLLQLDKALQETEGMIIQRDNSGEITNGLAIGAAAVGAGLTALSIFNLKFNRAADAGLGSFFIGAGALIASLTSILSGGTSALLKENVDTEKIDQQLKDVQTEIAKVQSTDKESASALVLLAHSVSEMRSTLKEYQENENDTSRNKLLSHAAQAAGAAVLYFAMRSEASATAIMGTILFTAGNLSRVVSGMSDSQAEQVLKEIRSTRTSLQLAVGSLD